MMKYLDLGKLANRGGADAYQQMVWVLSEQAEIGDAFADPGHIRTADALSRLPCILKVRSCSVSSACSRKCSESSAVAFSSSSTGLRQTPVFHVHEPE